MVKALCIGDVHIKVDNLPLIDLLEKQIKQVISLNSFDFIVVLGDVLHTHERLHTLALNRAHDFIGALSTAGGPPVFVLVGNHDYIQNDQFLTNNHWMNAMKVWPNVVVVDRAIEYGEAAFCPYVPVGRFREALDTAAFDWKQKEVIFAHQEFEGAVMNHGIISVHGDPWDAAFPLVVSGHIHGRQDLAAGIHYVGAALDSRAALTLLDGRTLSAAPLKFPKRNIIRNVSAAAVKEDYETWDLNDIAGVVIKDSFDSFKNFQKHPAATALMSAGVKITFKLEEEREAAANNSLDETAAAAGFEQLLIHEVLRTADEYLYSAAEKIISGAALDENSFILVPLK